jgi:hypothetical protein
VRGPGEESVECYPHMQVDTHPFLSPISVLTFSHPDYTVGPGVSPDPGACRPSALRPRIPPAMLTRSLSGLPALARALPTTPRGLYRRLGIGKARN